MGSRPFALYALLVVRNSSVRPSMKFYTRLLLLTVGFLSFLVVTLLYDCSITKLEVQPAVIKQAKGLSEKQLYHLEVNETSSQRLTAITSVTGAKVSTTTSSKVSTTTSSKVSTTLNINSYNPSAASTIRPGLSEKYQLKIHRSSSKAVTTLQSFTNASEVLSYVRPSIIHPNIWNLPYIPANSDFLKLTPKQKLLPMLLSKRLIDEVKYFSFFIGQGRGGTTIVGVLMDAHPNMIIATDYCLFLKWPQDADYHSNRTLLYTALHLQSRHVAGWILRIKFNMTKGDH